MRAVLIVLAVLSVASVAAARDMTVYWSQAFEQSTCMAWSSEHRAYPVYSCESADDFYSENGDTILAIEWWGHDMTLSGISEFLLRFCEDDLTSRWHMPGAIVYEETILNFSSEYLGVLADYVYSCDVPGGFAPNPGQTYWISIIGVHSGSHGGHQWSWYECVEADYWGSEGTLKSEFWGYPEWTPWSIRNYTHEPVEHAFTLYSRGDTPAQNTSWAEVKAMYR